MIYETINVCDNRQYEERKSDERSDNTVAYRGGERGWHRASP